MHLQPDFLNPGQICESIYHHAISFADGTVEELWYIIAVGRIKKWY